MAKPTLESVDQKLTALLEAQTRTGPCGVSYLGLGSIDIDTEHNRWMACLVAGGSMSVDASVAKLTRAQERSEQQLGEVMTLLQSIAQDVAALRGTTRVVIDADLGASGTGSPASKGTPLRQATAEDAQEIGASYDFLHFCYCGSSNCVDGPTGTGASLAASLNRFLPKPTPPPEPDPGSS